VVFSGSFNGNGTSAPAVVDFKSGVTAVGRANAGRYTIVLPGAGSSTLAGLSLTVRGETARIVQCRTYDAATRTLEILVANASGVATDLTSSEQCFVTAIIKNSSES
jgi:hypothetical protein